MHTSYCFWTEKHNLSKNLEALRLPWHLYALSVALISQLPIKPPQPDYKFFDIKDPKSQSRTSLYLQLKIQNFVFSSHEFLNVDSHKNDLNYIRLRG
jgi:hypothetical protein